MHQVHAYMSGWEFWHNVIGRPVCYCCGNWKHLTLWQALVSSMWTLSCILLYLVISCYILFSFSHDFLQKFHQCFLFLHELSGAKWVSGSHLRTVASPLKTTAEPPAPPAPPARRAWQLCAQQFEVCPCEAPDLRTSCSFLGVLVTVGFYMFLLRFLDASMNRIYDSHWCFCLERLGLLVGSAYGCVAFSSRQGRMRCLAIKSPSWNQSFRFLYLNRPQSTSRDKNPTSILGNQSYNPTFTSLFHQGYHESRDCGARSMHCNTPLSSDTSHESKSLFGDLRFGGQFGFSMNFHSHIDQTSQLWHGTTGQWPQVTLLITPRMGYSFKTSDFWSQGRTVEVWLGCVLCLKQLYSFRKLLRVVNDKQISTDLRCETVLADLVLNLISVWFFHVVGNRSP